MAKPTPKPTLAQSANTLAAIFSAVVQMSDDVKHAASALDAQGKMLRMQNSIQANAARIVPHIKTVIEAVEAEKAAVHAVPTPSRAVEAARAATAAAREAIIVATQNAAQAAPESDLRTLADAAIREAFGLAAGDYISGDPMHGVVLGIDDMRTCSEDADETAISIVVGEIEKRLASEPVPGH